MDVLAPNYCLSCGRVGSILCKCCKKDKLLLAPQKEGEVWVLGKRAGLLQDLIYRYKFQGERESGEILAGLLAECLPGNIPENTVVVPLPTVDRHVRMRGLDHTYLLAKSLAKRRGWRVQKVLARANDTVQMGTDGQKRVEQAWRAYKLASRAEVDPALPYLLLDDIWTTGASLLAAREILRKAGAKKIDLAVLAKS